MSFHDKSDKGPVRHVSKGALRVECYVKERNDKRVVYFFENDPGALYEKDPAAFDSIYGLPGKR